MPRKVSIHIPDWADEMLDSYGPDNSRSGTIAGLLGRYRDITDAACPTLSEAEWCCICDANNGCGLTFLLGSDHFQSLWANVADSEPDGLGEKWGVDLMALALLLRDLPPAGKAAVWDVAAKFWASPRLNELPVRDLLVSVGAKIS